MDGGILIMDTMDWGKATAAWGSHLVIKMKVPVKGPFRRLQDESLSLKPVFPVVPEPGCVIHIIF